MQFSISETLKNIGVGFTALSVLFGGVALIMWLSTFYYAPVVGGFLILAGISYGIGFIIRDYMRGSNG